MKARAVTVLAAVALLAALIARLPLLLGGQIDFDEGVYWASLRSMSEGHPLFSAVYSSQPPAFLESLHPAYSLLGHSLQGARLGMIAFWLIAVVAAHRAGRLLFGRRAGIAAALVIAVDPLMFRQSVALMADGPAVAWGLVAIALAAEARRSEGRRNQLMAMLAGAGLAVGVLTKLFDVAFAVPVLLLCVRPGQERSLRAVTTTTLCVAVGALVAAPPLLLPFADRLPDVWAQIVGGHVSARGLDEGGASPELLVTLLRELPLGLLGMAGIAVTARRHPRLAVILTAWAAAAVALLLAQRPLWPHHLIIAVPPFAIAAAALAERRLPVPTAGMRLRVATRGLAAVGAAGLVGAGVLGALALRQSAAADSVTGAAGLLSSVTTPRTIVVSDDPFSVTAAARDTPPELVDTSNVRLHSQPLGTADVVGIINREHVTAVLFATGRLSKLPGLSAWVAAHFPKAIDLGDRRTLYLTVHDRRPT